MTLERPQWEKLKATRERVRAAKRTSQLHAMAQSEIVAKQVTSSAAWNSFLQMLAALKEESEKALAEIDLQARTSEDFSHEELAHTQAIRRGWDMRIRTLDEVMALPAEIIDGAARAKERLKEPNLAETNETVSYTHLTLPTTPYV